MDHVLNHNYSKENCAYDEGPRQAHVQIHLKLTIFAILSDPNLQAIGKKQVWQVLGVSPAVAT